MKKINLCLLIFALFLFSIALTSCRDSSSDNRDKGQINSQTGDKTNDSQINQSNDKNKPSGSDSDINKQEKKTYYEFTGYKWDSFDYNYMRLTDSNLRVIKDRKYSIVNEFGEEIIKPKYTWINRFSEGFAEARDGDRLLYIDIDGNEYSDSSWQDILSFSDGLARVKINNKYGFIDKSFKIAIEPVYDETNYYFNEGSVAVKLNNKWSFIDKKGNHMFDVDKRAESIGCFVDGMCDVYDSLGQQGFINDKGELVIPIEFTVMGHDAPRFNNGSVVLGKYAADGTEEFYKYYKDGSFEPYVYDNGYPMANGPELKGDILPYFDEDKNLHGYKDKKGYIVIDAKWNCALEFEEFYGDFTFVQQNKLWGIINKQGEYVVKPQFDTIYKCELLDKDRFLVCVGYANQCGLIVMRYEDEYDTLPEKQWINFDESDSFDITYLNNLMVLEDYGYTICSDSFSGFDFCGSMDNDKALVYVHDENNKYGAIDENGDLVIPMKYDYIARWSEGYAAAKIGEKYCYINSEYEHATELLFDYAGSFSSGLALVMIDGKFGYLDQNMNYFIEPECAHATDFINGSAYVATDDARKIINANGETIMEFGPEYNLIQEWKNGFYMASYNEGMHIINSNGNIVKDTLNIFQPVLDDDAIKLYEEYSEASRKCIFYLKDNITTDYYDSIEFEYKDYFIAVKDNKHYLIDKHNNILMCIDDIKYNDGMLDINLELKCMFDNDGLKSNDEYICFRDPNTEKAIMVDKAGNTVQDINFEIITGFQNGLAAVRTAESYGYIDEEFNNIIKCKFQNAGEFSAIIDNLACVNIDGKYGFINTAGDVVIRTEYNYLECLKNDLWDSDIIIAGNENVNHIYIKRK